ncbi:MAG: DHH family phosphoesterase, partial [Desulfovibrio sp.]|nr:DHH family phosphoesterase [Desulfovibrio sp.]
MLLSEALPEAFREGAVRVAHVLPSLEDVIISAHVNPDGDAVGSMCCAAMILKHFKQRCILYSSTGIPEFLRFFHLPCTLISNLADAPFTPKTCFLVDLNAFYRIGGDFAEVAETLPSINIDHHEGVGVGSLASYVEPTAASTTQLMYYLAQVLQIPMNAEFVRAVALGIITDTGGFAYANTSAECLEMCAQLLRLGLDLSKLRQQIDNCISINRMRLWGALTSQVQLLCNNEIAFCAVSKEILLKFLATRDDLEGFVEYLRRLQGVRISCVVREDAENSCK